MIRNVTLSAEEELIEKARRRATTQETTLNAVFRQWLERYVAEQGAKEAYEELMARLSHVRPGRTFTRDEMNDR